MKLQVESCSTTPMNSEFSEKLQFRASVHLFGGEVPNPPTESPHHPMLRGPYAQNKKKNLYYSFDCVEIFRTYVKLKIKWGKCPKLFSIFFI